MELMSQSLNDKAGKLMGWSIGTGLNGQSLDQLLELPCVFDFKAVGVANSEFKTGLVARVESELGRQLKEHEYSERSSAKGNYLSVTLHLFVKTIDEVYAIYAAMRDHDTVKMLL